MISNGGSVSDAPIQSFPVDELACGCRLHPAPGRLCRTGAALLAAAALAEGFAATAPEDKLLDRSASHCLNALLRHLGARPGAPALPPEFAAVVQRLEGGDPILSTTRRMKRPPQRRTESP